jgi:hypothetical protein
MKFIASDYSGFKEIVTQLGAPTEVFYRGDASSTVTSLIIAYYAAGIAVMYQSSGQVNISTVLTDYASAALVPGLAGVEV